MIDDDHRLRFEKKGFVLKGMKMFSCPKAVAEEHYEDLSAKPFFGTCGAFPKSMHTVCGPYVTVYCPWSSTRPSLKGSALHTAQVHCSARVRPTVC